MIVYRERNFFSKCTTSLTACTFRKPPFVPLQKMQGADSCGDLSLHLSCGIQAAAKRERAQNQIRGVWVGGSCAVVVVSLMCCSLPRKDSPGVDDAGSTYVRRPVTTQPSVRAPSRQNATSRMYKYAQPANRLIFTVID